MGRGGFPEHTSCLVPFREAELWSEAEPALLGSVLSCRETRGLPRASVALVPRSGLTGKV